MHMLIYCHRDKCRACAEAGAIPSKRGFDQLFWDKVSRDRVSALWMTQIMEIRDGLWSNSDYCTLYSYFIGFQEAVLLKDGKEWSDLNWTRWDLAAFPEDYTRRRRTDPWPDISTWRMWCMHQLSICFTFCYGNVELGFPDPGLKTGWMMQSLRFFKFIWPTKYSFSYPEFL